MKVVACIAEYNPFHFGHAKHLEYIRRELGADKIIVVMSGNFTQRGDIAVLNKFERARHAVLAGADMVIELPTVFATANAEIFAKGAVGLISSLSVVDELCFGVEGGSAEEYVALAAAMNDESKEFKKALKDFLDQGVSLAKAKFLALQRSGENFNESLISSPNNVLGVEYTKALLDIKSDIRIAPMLRLGDHNDRTLKKGITSATSIRDALRAGEKSKVKKCVPDFVFDDLKEYPHSFDKIVLAKTILTSAKDMAEVPDCTEGLENRIKALVKDNKTVDGLVEKVKTKRYTETRIRRILTANLLGVTRSLTSDALKSNTYAKILCVNDDSKDLISMIAERGSIPVITRKSDVALLKKTALKCFERDCVANELYNLVTGDNANENYMLII